MKKYTLLYINAKQNHTKKFPFFSFKHFVSKKNILRGLSSFNPPSRINLYHCKALLIREYYFLEFFVDKKYMKFFE